MKVVFAVFMLSICFLPNMAFGQDSRYVGVELLGNGGLYSLNYFHDFSNERSTSYWGFRAGFSLYSTKDTESFDSLSFWRTQYFVPLSVHYTIRDRLEFGLGITLIADVNGDVINGERTHTTDLLTWLVPSIGYRKPLGENWLFKATFTPIIRSESDGGGWFPWLGLTFARKLRPSAAK